MHLHLASLLVALPLFGSLAIAMLSDEGEDVAQQIATGTATAAMLVALAIGWVWDPIAGGVQLLDRYPWSTSLNLAWAVGVDGLSLPLVVLTTVLFLVAVLGSSHVHPRKRAYLAWLVALEAPTLGVFLAQDWTLFYACWELTLVPLFFLISAWGGAHKERAALTFLLYTMAGSVFLLNATLVLVILGPGRGAFPADATAAALPIAVQLGLLFAFLVGFGVKVPLVPLHGWLPLAHVEAPAPVSVLLSGILLKMGAYGLIRVVQALPDAAVLASWGLFVLGTVGVLHGALLAWRQQDLKSIVAWSSVSHMGFVVVGVSALNEVGLHGAMLQIVAHGLVAGILFLLVGAVYERAHTRDLTKLGSIVHEAPVLTGAVAFGFLASISVPGTAGFVAELMVIAGAWERFGAFALLPLLGAILWAASAVRAALSLVGGPRTEAGHHVTEIRPGEAIAVGLLTIGLIAVGLRPALVADIVAHEVHTLVAALPAPAVEVAHVAP